MTYKIKIKKIGAWFYRTYTVAGHEMTNARMSRRGVVEEGPYRLDLTMPDGSIISIGEAAQIQLVLGKEWVAVQQKQQEEQRKLIDMASKPKENQPSGRRL